MLIWLNKNERKHLIRSLEAMEKCLGDGSVKSCPLWPTEILELMERLNGRRVWWRR